MVNVILRRLIGAAAVAGGAVAVTAGARFAASKRINAAEKLGKALLETSRIEEAAGYADAESEAALAACGAYLIQVAHEAAAGISGPPMIDPIGFERRVTSERSSAAATVITTAHEPESRWQFELAVPGLARVSGSRRLKSSKFTGPNIHMSTPDTLCIRFDSGYAVNIESEMEFTSSLLKLSRGTRIHGKAQLSDNRRNVALLQIDNGGEVTGTVTRGAEIVGRFEGSLSEGVTFRQYHGGSA